MLGIVKITPRILGNSLEFDAQGNITDIKIQRRLRYEMTDMDEKSNTTRSGFIQEDDEVSVWAQLLPETRVNIQNGVIEALQIAAKMP